MLSSPVMDRPSQSRLVDCGQFTLNCRIWPGDPDRSVVIWHGVTGTSLDHVELAERLSRAGHLVVAPDSLGCGASDWAGPSQTAYGLDALADVASAMFDRLGIGRLSWIGLSKGGGLGITVAARQAGRIDAIVLCDVGPGLPAAFRHALAQRLAAPPRYRTIAAFRDHVSRLLERSGLGGREALVDRLALAWSRHLDDGEVGYHYDPAISNQFLHNAEDFDLWARWDCLACPILVLRGQHSTVLTDDELGAMLTRNPAATSIVLEGIGHLNFLDDAAHQDAIIRFLEGSADE